MGRYRQFLRQRYRAILSYIGLMGLISGGILLLPLLALFAYPEELSLAWGFWLPGLALALLGLLMWQKLAPQKPISLTVPEGAAIVMFSWMLAIAFGSVPFLAVGGLNLTQAVFESTSGWTTTGLSVVDVSRTSHLILLLRSLTQLVGGAGFAIIALSALTATGSGLVAAEGRSEQLVPHVRQSAKLVLSIYTGYVALGTIGLRGAGMDWFDAVNHAFTALSTGGFSTRTESIGAWNSPAIEAVTIALMLAGSLNYATSFLLLRGKWAAVGRNSELQVTVLLIPLGVILLLLGVTNQIYPTLEKALRVAVFETVTALSTTGYTTVNYGDWNGLGWLVLIVLMLVGGETGSTAGGIKQYRLYLLYRGLVWQVQEALLPKNAVLQPHFWQGEYRRFLSDRQIRQVSALFFTYVVAYLFGVGILTAYGYSLPDSLFEYASTVGTVGLSLGITTPDAPAGVLWIEILGMFGGRLEFLTILMGLGWLLQNVRQV